MAIWALSEPRRVSGPPKTCPLKENWKFPSLSQVLLSLGDSVNTVLGCFFNKMQTKPKRRKTIKLNLTAHWLMKQQIVVLRKGPEQGEVAVSEQTVLCEQFYLVRKKKRKSLIWMIYLEVLSRLTFGKSQN